MRKEETHSRAAAMCFDLEAQIKKNQNIELSKIQLVEVNDHILKITNELNKTRPIATKMMQYLKVSGE